MNKISIS